MTGALLRDLPSVDEVLRKLIHLGPLPPKLLADIEAGRERISRTETRCGDLLGF